MLKRIVIILIILSFLLINNKNEQIIISKETKKDETEEIGRIIIPKLNLSEPLFKIDSPENTIEKHIEILKESTFPDQKNSLILIAAHSGTGNIAYFEELDELKANDKIILIINNKEYIYYVKDIWEERKSGYININKEDTKQLILTTCSPKHNNYQLIINCIEKST